MRHVDHHLESRCADHVNVTAASIIQKSLLAPLSVVKKNMVSHLVHHKISSHSEDNITIYEGNPVRSHMNCT